MPSMIESLVGQAAERPDEKRYTPARRSALLRPRDLFDLLGALGRDANFAMLNRSITAKAADPRQLTFAVLGRWPTLGELPGDPEQFEMKKFVKQLLGTEEFTRHLHQRLLEAFPERRRLLYVKVPCCGGDEFMRVVQSLHLLLPEQFPRGADMVAALGPILARLGQTSSFLLAAPKARMFVDASEPPAGEIGLDWTFVAPAYRTLDRLFTLIRDPEAIVLAMANARLETGAESAGEWVSRGERLLADRALHNPICSALGDGTAKGARLVARRTNLEIADTSDFESWIRTTWDIEPEWTPKPDEGVLRREALSAAGREALALATAEDRRFYDWVAEARKGSEGAVMGASM